MPILLVLLVFGGLLILAQGSAVARDVKTLQKFAAVHASIHNHFNHDRHLSRRDIFKQHRFAALAE
ncbi:MAG: hypothetical protein MUO37_10485, partial [Methyloceanibacter sp.]|nr:hypothetical protein [Methyloceanibacter sp.]